MKTGSPPRLGSYGAFDKRQFAGHGGHGTETAHRPREPWHRDISPATGAMAQFLFFVRDRSVLFQQTNTLAQLQHLIRGNHGQSQQ